MERNAPRTSLAALFIATTLLALVTACWVNYPDGEWNIATTAAATAIVGAMLTPFGIKCGITMGVVTVFAACVVVGKDPSGLGPTDIILPIQMIVSAVPITAAAWTGRWLRTQLSP